MWAVTLCVYCDDDMCHCWAHRAPGTIDDLDDGHQDDLDGCKWNVLEWAVGIVPDQGPEPWPPAPWQVHA